MANSLVSVSLWGCLTALTLTFTASFGYLYHKDRDERKLMFMLALLYAAFSYLPMVHGGEESHWIIDRLLHWAPLPIVSATLITVLSTLLKLKQFNKPFKVFIIILSATTLMILVPHSLELRPTLFFQSTAILVICASIYLYLSRGEISGLMFLLSTVCFISGSMAITRNLGVEFTVFAFLFAFVFIGLAFLISKQTVGEEMASFFALRAELKDTRRELARSQERLREAQKLATIGHTTAMVGHDLRNPLQSLTNTLYLAQSKLESTNIPNQESLHTLWKGMKKQVKYMDKIVSDLQDYARPIKPKLLPTNLHQLIKNTLSTVTIPQKIQTSIKVKSDLRSQKIQLDPQLMKRILTNLILNAIQAMPKGGQLTIEASHTEDLILISIKDTGVGIPKKDLPKLFQPLFTTKARGQGLGLPTCKRLVEAHNGKITIQSQVGEGSTVTAEVPLKRSEGSGGEAPLNSLTPSSSPPERSVSHPS